MNNPADYEKEKAIDKLKLLLNDLKLNGEKEKKKEKVILIPNYLLLELQKY